MVNGIHRNILLGLVALVTIGLQGAPVSAQVRHADVTGIVRRTGTFVPPRQLEMLFHKDPPDDVPVHKAFNGKEVTDEEWNFLNHLHGPQAKFKPGIPDLNEINPLTAGYLYETSGLNATQTGGWLPPDDSVAIGATSAIEPSNSAVGVFTRNASGLTLTSLVDANVFMNFAPTTTTAEGGIAFDPRAMYDYQDGHFFISFSSFPFQDSKNVWHTYFLIAVSTTKDATGRWVQYALDYIPLNPGLSSADQAGLLFDYPDIGMDANNVYCTANIFTGTGSAFGTLIAFDKASMEAGKANVPFAVLNGTSFGTTPPYVWSQGKSKQSYFVYSLAGEVGPTSQTGYIGMYAVSGKARDGSLTISNSYGVVVPYYSPSLYAEQPGLIPIDPLDTRFQDKSTQRGETVYATNCVSFLGFPMVTAYQMNGLYGTLMQSIDLVSSPTSFDFNPSIAVNGSGTAVVNWNATDVSKLVAANNIYESVRSITLGSKWGTTPKPGTLVPGATSTQSYQDWRNGDYSMTMVDPLNDKQFWAINQTVMDEFDWNTYIFELSVK